VSRAAVRLASGEVIEAQVAATNGRSGTDWAVGETVTVEIEPGAAVGIVSKAA